MDQDLSEFPSEVITQLQHYVYRLIDPRNGETFYVGKGKGNRLFQHMKGALSADEFDESNDKMRRIREILAAGLKVIHVVHRHGMDEKTAIEVESALIDAYPGMTNLIGGGGSIEYGPMNALQIIEKYSAEEAHFDDKVMMITINRISAERSIYDATRFAWKINKSKAEMADYVLAVIQGIIVGVFVVEEWAAATKANFPEIPDEAPERFAFRGKEADTLVQQKYKRKRVPPEFRKKGAANPIKYSY